MSIRVAVSTAFAFIIYTVVFYMTYLAVEEFGYNDLSILIGLGISAFQVIYSLFHIVKIFNNDEFLYDNIVESVPTVCIELGIVGTFIGFAFIIDGGIDLQSMDDIRGVMLSLGTSITGLLVAIGFRVFHDSRCHTPQDLIARHINRIGLLHEFTEMRDYVISFNKNLADLQSKTNGQNLQQKFSDLETTITNFTLPTITVDEGEIDVTSVKTAIDTSTESFNNVSTQLKGLNDALDKTKFKDNLEGFTAMESFPGNITALKNAMTNATGAISTLKADELKALNSELDATLTLTRDRYLALVPTEASISSLKSVLTQFEKISNQNIGEEVIKLKTLLTAINGLSSAKIDQFNGLLLGLIDRLNKLAETNNLLNTKIKKTNE